MAELVHGHLIQVNTVGRFARPKLVGVEVRAAAKLRKIGMSFYFQVKLELFVILDSDEIFHAKKFQRLKSLCFKNVQRVFSLEMMENSYLKNVIITLIFEHFFFALFSN